MPASAARTLYLIDGHALAYRTYFALTGSGFQGSSRSGDPTAGVFGFTSVLLRLLEQESPDYLAVSFDVGKTFRDEMFPDYKATREKMPDDLRVQIERIHEVVRAFNIPVFTREGYEADDVLGSLSRLAARGRSPLAWEARIDETLDGLAQHLEDALDLDRILEIARAA